MTYLGLRRHIYAISLRIRNYTTQYDTSMDVPIVCCTKYAVNVH